MLTLAAACVIACNGNDAKYNVSGNNAPEDGAVVRLVDKLTESPIDSAVVAGGTFTMKGKAPKEALLSVEVDGWDWRFPLINDGEPVQINLADSTCTGSALNTKLSECDRRDGAAYADYMRFVQAFLALPKEEQEAKEDEFVRDYEIELQKYTDSLVEMIEENKDNLIPVAFIQNFYAVADDKFDEFVSSDAPAAKHPFVQDFKRKMDEKFADQKEAEKSKKAVIGQRFLELEQADPDGKMHKLSEYAGQGKWVLVDFWASWCGPCKAEMPNVVEAYKKYHSKGFEIVGISFDKEKEPWVKAIADWGMPWIHLSDLKYWNNEANEVYSVNAIPDNLLIDPDGIVVARGLRGEGLQSRLAEIFQ